MKKLKLGIILLALSIVLMSCGNSNDTPEKQVSSYVKEILAEPEIQNLIEKNKKSGMDLTIIAEGTSIVYQYKYIESIEEINVDGSVTAGIESYINEQATVFIREEALAEFQNECPSVTSLNYEYYDNQGNLLTSKIYE